jgi:hypothetical protein
MWSTLNTSYHGHQTRFLRTRPSTNLFTISLRISVFKPFLFVHTSSTAKISNDLRARYFFVLVFFSFHFRHHFSVGAGGAGSIDCISSLQRQLNSYTLGKGKARLLKVHTKREAMAHSFVACFGEEPATERSGWETFAVYMLRHWMCKVFWFRLFIRRHSCLEKI